MRVQPSQNGQDGSNTETALTLGLIGRSLKPDEHRVPVHPAHLDRIPEHLRRHILVEEGYGLPFGMSVAEIVALVGSRRHL